MEGLVSAVPMSVEIYEHMIKEMQEHSIRNEEVYQLQISSLKEKLREKDEMLGSMSRRLNSELTHSEVSESRQSIFEEPESLTAFTINRQEMLVIQQSVSQDSHLDQTHKPSQHESRISSTSALEIEEETKHLKQELNELFKAKEAESKELNLVIDEQKLQLLEYQTEKMSLIDANHQLALENTKVVAQLQDLTGACNHLKDICSQQTQELEGRALACRTQAAEVDSLREQLKVNGDAAQASLREKEADLHTKDQQLQQLLEANTSLITEIQGLKKEKEVKKEHSEKQHRLIVQYEKKNDENIREIRKLESDLLSLAAQLENERAQYSKLESEARTYAETYQKQLANKDALIEDLTINSKRRFKAIGNKVLEYISELASGLRSELSDLRQDLWSWSHSTSEVLIQSAGALEFRSVSCAGTVQTSNVSVFNREELLEFEVEELKKEVIALRKDNFQLKFENKRLQEKKLAAAKKQEELKAQIQKLHQELSRGKAIETEHAEQKYEPFKLSDIGNKTAVQTRTRKESKSRRESVNDQKIIQQITEMRKRIRDVREECQLKSTR